MQWLGRSKRTKEKAGLLRQRDLVRWNGSSCLQVWLQKQDLARRPLFCA